MFDDILVLTSESTATSEEKQAALNRMMIRTLEKLFDSCCIYKMPHLGYDVILVEDIQREISNLKKSIK